MTFSKLINYTTREFMSENELELYATKQDEIFTPKVIEEFKKAGLDTAKSVLEQDVEDLIKRTDLEEETIIEVRNVLNAEFSE